MSGGANRLPPFKFIIGASALEITEKKRERLGNFAFMFFDIFFYFLSIDTRPRSTFILSQIVCELMKQKVFSEDVILKELVVKKVADEISSVVNKVATKEGLESLELLNLLYIQRQLGGPYIYTCERFLKLSNFSDLMKNRKLGYFQIISAFSYFRTLSDYSVPRAELCDYVVDLFSQGSNYLERADGFCLLFDILSCPYIDNSVKHNLVVAAFTAMGKKPSLNESIAVIKYVSKRQWFTSWDESLTLEALLEKFELNPCY